MAGLCGWALSSSCPPLGRAPELCQLCGWALWLGLVLLLSSSWPRVAGLCGWALSSSCPPLGRAPELCQFWPRPELCQLYGRALWAGSVAGLSGPCPPLRCCQLCGWALWLGLVLLLSLNSVNSVAGLCGWALSSSCPPLGRAPELLFPSWPSPELCQLCGWAMWLGLVLLSSCSWPRP